MRSNHAARRDSCIEVPDITVLVVLGDPADDYFMGSSLGLSADGSVPGYLFLNVWPYPENRARLEATAVHELNHNLRDSSGGVGWSPETVTVVGTRGVRGFGRCVTGSCTATTRLHAYWSGAPA